jgi:protein phosphatase
MSLKGKVRIVERTHVGQVREHNEDCIASDAARGIAILADGMGGMNAGEVASSMTVSVVLDELISHLDETLRSYGPDGEAGLNSAARLLKASVESANNAVFHVAQSRPLYQGMGTTIVAALFHDNRLNIAHVGDSRMYLFRGGSLSQVTRDHSFVQELIDRGLYTPAEARESSRKNVVTRAVGIAPHVDVETATRETQVGDVYLLCSDGLTDLVRDQDLERVMTIMARDLDAMADQMIELANASGGRDNVSVMLVKILKPFPAQGGLVERIVNWFD